MKQSAQKKDPTIMTADEVAKMLGIGRRAVYAGAAAGEIPCRRVGRRFIFTREAIAAWAKLAAAMLFVFEVVR